MRPSHEDSEMKRTQSGFKFSRNFPHEARVLCEEFDISLISRVEKYWAVPITSSVWVVRQISVGIIPFEWTSAANCVNSPRNYSPNFECFIVDKCEMIQRYIKVINFVLVIACEYCAERACRRQCKILQNHFWPDNAICGRLYKRAEAVNNNQSLQILDKSL